MIYTFKGSYFSINMPYGFAQMKDGAYIAYNRLYSGLGSPERHGADWEELPRIHIPRAIVEQVKQPRDSLKQFWLYGNGKHPEDSPEAMAAYLEKLKVIMQHSDNVENGFERTDWTPPNKKSYFCDHVLRREITDDQIGDFTRTVQDDEQFRGITTREELEAYCEARQPYEAHHCAMLAFGEWLDILHELGDDCEATPEYQQWFDEHEKDMQERGPQIFRAAQELHALYPSFELAQWLSRNATFNDDDPDNTVFAGSADPRLPKTAADWVALGNAAVKAYDLALLPNPFESGFKELSDLLVTLKSRLEDAMLRRHISGNDPRAVSCHVFYGGLAPADGIFPEGDFFAGYDDAHKQKDAA